MATPTPLGIKRTCPSCSNRFYDLNRRPAACPKCGHSYDPAQQARPRRPRRVATETSGEGDLLIQHMAKTKPVARPKKEKDEVVVEDLEAIAPVAEDDIEEIEEIEDIGAIEEIEEPVEEAMDDDITLEEGAAAESSLIDTIDEDADVEEEGEEEEESAAARKSKKRRK